MLSSMSKRLKLPQSPHRSCAKTDDSTSISQNLSPVIAGLFSSEIWSSTSGLGFSSWVFVTSFWNEAEHSSAYFWQCKELAPDPLEVLSKATISSSWTLCLLVKRFPWNFRFLRLWDENFGIFVRKLVSLVKIHTAQRCKRPHCLLKVLENEADGYQSPRVCASARKLRWEHFQHGNQVTLLSKLQFITIYEQNIDKKTILPKNWIIKDVNTSKKIFRQFLIKIAFFLYSTTFLTFSTLRSSSLWRTFLKNKNFVFVTFRLPQVK